MHQACWLYEYATHTRPDVAYKNNNESARQMIESAIHDVSNTLALDANQKSFLFNWMDGFRKTKSESFS